MNRLMLTCLAILVIGGAVSAQTFLHDMEEAKTLAEKEHRHILMIFSGSDWCKPCMQLKSDIISNEVFVEYADHNLVLLEVDFPYRKSNQLPKEQRLHNERLAEQYNPNGVFPLMLLMDEQEEILGSMNYKKTWLPEDVVMGIQIKIEETEVESGEKSGE